MKKWAKRIYQKWLFNLSASNNRLYIGYYRYVHRPKPDSLDEFLNLFSRTTRPLTVIQVGANDGITHDPIHKYIKRDNWRGVLLEPQKDVFTKKLCKIYALDAKINTVNAALGLQEGTRSIYKIGFSNARWATGLTSFRRDVVESAFESGHVARQALKEGIPVPEDPADWIVEEPVKVLTVAHLIEEFQLNQIDLLQIDTEGYDFEIIKMFDLSQVVPRVIVYENIHLSRQDEEACEQYLSQAGYQIRQLEGNTLAMLNPVGHFQAFFKR